MLTVIEAASEVAFRCFYSDISMLLRGGNIDCNYNCINNVMRLIFLIEYYKYRNIKF